MLIRKRGLQVRMEEPAEFLKQMNRLCVKMTHARRKKDGKRARKAVLREMKKLSKIIAAHAGRHLELLNGRWRETDFKEGQTRQIAERIIGERQVKNGEKILSLYEGHADVYVRGKAGAEVEFGSQLLLGESESGVIVDWELVNGTPKADTKMLGRSLDRLKQTAGGTSRRQRVRRSRVRQQGESRTAGKRRDLQCDLPEGARGTEGANEGRGICRDASKALANRSSHLDFQERIPGRSLTEQMA